MDPCHRMYQLDLLDPVDLEDQGTLVYLLDQMDHASHIVIYQNLLELIFFVIIWIPNGFANDLSINVTKSS